jgi:hypothetical protein
MPSKIRGSHPLVHNEPESNESVSGDAIHRLNAVDLVQEVVHGHPLRVVEKILA